MSRTFTWLFINEEGPHPIVTATWRPDLLQTGENNPTKFFQTLSANVGAPKRTGHLCLLVGGLSDGPRLRLKMKSLNAGISSIEDASWIGQPLGVSIHFHPHILTVSEALDYVGSID